VLKYETEGPLPEVERTLFRNVSENADVGSGWRIQPVHHFICDGHESTFRQPEGADVGALEARLDAARDWQAL
jgi:hypothetical protein